ncbi:putative 2-octaprenyl-3-methyl-6-methoxy-1,4-benzoquinol hydroxylase [Dinoroseobacter shibae DFL 12 = DSM 16493]|jgi:2-octaprenyl-6-methoxyphenol hydroxylase|uniref:Putative 2-octaprenyl-3-methyl-6-methoxy-1,4-benzoquinol hydroxylase n=1 Tax=Dinoroseobacter shibae (strain DSM 16493 / NCIMB 14021 / DFL 12) TaxID=398580 RepID=A8LS35_DINSH|nr:UbiH/UbiF family hydroxylase [Dinoroseobacter shibae]ABV94128.1 putative 2-octaprenyl-3-methyl-6-methoxy-1,4-benzoquinol hydroxylase [Dinoroseobacter shibae DFL 12 = DSM 16493]URF45569.1 UbiH/UbiF family hydroxylase [Dinoroseobacter shibae]URF49874.1 UbiH/UbiF family hydroxylase [Dinoroseobacter shibae]
MQTEQTDILISGGGVAGLSAAAAFGSAGFQVIVVDPAPPVTEGAADGADMRTTAFLQPSREVLEKAGLWARLAPFAAPLQVMQIIDAGGTEPVARVQKAFNARDISDDPFGWNLQNWLLRREMVARLEELPNVTFRPGVGTADVLAREREARVRLTDGTMVSARLLIAADGRNSPVRNALGIGVRTTRYGQKALAFAVTHPIPHDNVSTEIHRSGGPFTLVPLPDLEGQPRSAIVWMERGPEALRLASCDVAEFEAEMTARSTGLLGPLKLVSRRSVWPIISQMAERLTGPRTALIAEAAHVVPPIGAQGLNMSLADVRVLLELAEAAPDTLGSPEMLQAYARKRAPDVRTRITGIDLLNRASMAGAQPLRDARAQGLKALYGLAPVRKSLMQLGLGVR